MAKAKSKPKRRSKSKRSSVKAVSSAKVTLSPEQEAFAARLQSDFVDIGAVVVEFSQLEFSIRFVLADAIRLDHQYFDVVLSAFDFATLCRVTSTILQKQRPQEKEAIERLYNECLALNTERVRVAPDFGRSVEEVPATSHGPRSEPRITSRRTGNCSGWPWKLSA
jgi:hypothetical protein